MTSFHYFSRYLQFIPTICECLLEWCRQVLTYLISRSFMLLQRSNSKDAFLKKYIRSFLILTLIRSFLILQQLHKFTGCPWSSDANICLFLCLKLYTHLITDATMRKISWNEIYLAVEDNPRINVFVCYHPEQSFECV